jgi:hypothetical protein
VEEAVIPTVHQEGLVLHLVQLVIFGQVVQFPVLLAIMHVAKEVTILVNVLK